MIYEYKCLKCGHIQEYVMSVSEYEKFHPKHCKQEMAQVLSAHPISFVRNRSFQNYKCPVTDQVVTSPRQRQNIMKEHDLVEKDFKVTPKV